jgi:hypothetical protein
MANQPSGVTRRLLLKGTSVVAVAGTGTLTA